MPPVSPPHCISFLTYHPRAEMDGNQRCFLCFLSCTYRILRFSYRNTDYIARSLLACGHFLNNSYIQFNSPTSHYALYIIRHFSLSSHHRACSSLNFALSKSFARHFPSSIHPIRYFAIVPEIAMIPFRIERFSRPSLASGGQQCCF